MLIKISDISVEKAMEKNANIKKFKTQIVYKLLSTEWDQQCDILFTLMCTPG